jgi:hypothetical protein
MSMEVSQKEFELLKKRCDVLEKHIATLLRYSYRNDLCTRKYFYQLNPALFALYVPGALTPLYSKNGGTSSALAAKLTDIMVPSWERVGNSTYTAGPV